MMKYVEDFKQKLILLAPLFAYLRDSATRVKEAEKLSPLIEVLDKAATLVYSCFVEKSGESKSQLLCDLIEETKVKAFYMMGLRATEQFSKGPFESELCLLDNLIQFLRGKGYNLNAPGKKLQLELKRLRSILAVQPALRLEKFNYLIASIEAITCSAIPILHSCEVKKMRADMAKEVDQALSQVLDQIKRIEKDLEVIRLPSLHPKTDGLGFLQLFCKNLKQLQDCRPQLIETIKIETQTLYKEFNILSSFLRTGKQQHGDENKELRDRVIGLAYEAEHVIDFFMANNSDPRISLSVAKIIGDVEVVRSELTITHTKFVDPEPLDSASIISYDVPSSPQVNTTFAESSDFVGFQKELEEIRACLTDGPSGRDVVSVVGMPGSGKTTLAKKLYEDPSILVRFDVRAWCTVPQTYQKRKLILSILSDLGVHHYEVSKLNDNRLADALRERLKRQKYLIVIDNMLLLEAWNDLKSYLPNDGYFRSRVLITTRYDEVAFKTTSGEEEASQIKSNRNVCRLRLSTDDEILELFQRMLGPKESYSEELLQIGQQIALSYKHLPLAATFIGGLLSREKRGVGKWKEIADCLSSHILKNSESPFKSMLEVCYNYLPDHLKACFLYVGTFQPHQHIPVWKLKLLWIAEGFVRGEVSDEGMEKLAEHYLLELIGRSLVTPTKERAGGGVKTCCVHDLLREFCLEKAEEEGFMKVLKVTDGSKFSRVYDHHRLSISAEPYNFTRAMPSGSGVRSLLYAISENITGIKYDASFITQNFRLLKVLDLADINICKSVDKIEMLVHLRYLAVFALVNTFPPSISALWNLQTLLFRANYEHQDKVVNVPDWLWDMVNLRHIHVGHHAWYQVNSSRSSLENSPFPENIKTLSRPFFSSTEDAFNLLRRLPKLEKLKCEFGDCSDRSKKCCRYPELDFLTQLISLSVSSFGSGYSPGYTHKFSFPPNLRKLTLSGFDLSWEEMSDVGRKLSNLEVLKIRSDCSGRTWKVSDEDFPNLKYLKLSGISTIHEWVASEESFPQLEQLVLEDCRNLMEIPLRFAVATPLQLITVQRCLPSLNESAREIGHYQKDQLQKERFNVNITKRRPFE